MGVKKFPGGIGHNWRALSVINQDLDNHGGYDLHNNRDYYDSAIKSGHIQVDGNTVPDSYRVQSSRKISHLVHRHEPPVTALDVTALHKGEDVLTKSALSGILESLEAFHVSFTLTCIKTLKEYPAEACKLKLSVLDLTHYSGLPLRLVRLA